MSAGEALLPPQGAKGCSISPPAWPSSGFHEHRSRCNPNPCFSGVDCMETYEYPGYRCGPCPPGLEGNGTYCADIDEVGTVLGWVSSPSAARAVRTDDTSPLRMHPEAGEGPRQDAPGQWSPQGAGCHA